MFNKKHEFIMALMMGRKFTLMDTGTLYTLFYSEWDRNPFRRVYAEDYRCNGAPMTSHDFDNYKDVKELNLNNPDNY